MRIAAISLIKDECDIIELFVRINAGWADHFFILDNGSSDFTPHILRRLTDEGFPITVQSDNSIHYNQREMTTRLAATALKTGSFDFVFPIDGDEFVLDVAAFKAGLAELPTGKIAALEWATLVPVDSNVMSRSAPLFDGFSRRRTELRQVCKVVLPADIAKVATIEMGNHGATDGHGNALPQHLLPVQLGHVPVRSKEQIIAKTLIGSHKMSIKAGRKKDEIFHWDLIAQFARQYAFQLSDEQLRDIALSYGWSKNDPKVRETLPISIGTAEDVVRFPELARPNLPLLLDGFMAQLCAEVNLTRSTAGLARKALVALLRRLR